ncbi:Uncharacterized membrane protein YhaH, DUF805 family [Flavobacterium aquidurense]|uniref:DUF805 domain-containing protein n=1 Tax=Flavobacterium frigidimaris TaxID=262320 RepID=A0ABX4BWA9_FLAFR|nr:DUF805 domain-containing protein [Flavobacterium frigidimaris]OXA81845.1 hypothetical protein B0A65_02095 [Flavobacterium frigidimaris]SDZ34761.1 Uncharacterized membrane protein YhaH, DUF805 family [Flavobacterium aquidurense]
MIEWYKKAVFENYADFTGRARRSEYWYFRLATTVIFLLFIILGVVVYATTSNGPLAVGLACGLLVLYSLLTLIPSLSVSVRRMHDIGKSGWTILVSMIPLVGPIWILVLLFTEGDSGENYYGADPKSEVEEINEIGNVELQ